MRFQIFVSTMLMGTSIGWAQILSLNTTPDSRNIVMGESFVANPFSPFSLDNNPATLSGIKGLVTLYSFRDLNWYDFDDFHVIGVGLFAQTTYGFLGLSYKRFHIGGVPLTTESDPESISALISLFDYTLALSYANKLSEHFSVGFNLKRYDNGVKVIQGAYSKPGSKAAFLADAGILYSIKGFAQEESLQDEVHFGISIQNYGTDFERQIQKRDGNYEYIVQKLPRYVRAGIAYKIASHYSKTFSELQLLLTVEYKKYLNPGRYEEDLTDFWGMGIEAWFFELAAMRLGGVIQPFTNIFGEKGSLSMRYGFGLHIPPRIFKLDLPVSIFFDYGVVPINTNLGFIAPSKTKLASYNLQLRYDFSSND